jgi:serine/threonine protein kinase
MAIKYNSMQKVGGHELEVRIGAGSFARIYKTSKNTAVKVYKEWSSYDTFRAEVRTCEYLKAIIGSNGEKFRGDSRYLVKYYDSGAGLEYKNGEVYMKMYIHYELINAKHLRYILKDARFKKSDPRTNIGSRIAIAKDIITAIRYLHANGLIHTDIAPANILIGEDSKTLKLCDYGGSIKTEKAHVLTGERLGTDGYASPEFLARAPFDASSDIWSAFVIIYELLTFSELFPSKHEETMESEDSSEEEGYPSDADESLFSESSCSNLMSEDSSSDDEGPSSTFENLRQMEEMFGPSTTLRDVHYYNSDGKLSYNDEAVEIKRTGFPSTSAFIDSKVAQLADKFLLKGLILDQTKRISAEMALKDKFFNVK